MSDKLKVGIINTGTSNLNSVQLACKKVGLTSQVIDENNNLKEYGGLILPGVGAFDKVASELFEKGLDIKIKKFIETEKPLLGICLGFQLLFDFSEEFNGHSGLGVLDGNIKKIPTKSNIKKGQKIRVPFIGWSRINKCNEEENSSWNKKPLSLIPDKTPMYFVHSYYADVKNKYVSSITNYGDFTCCGSVSYNNIFACQFHPEKSADYGLSIFNSFKNEIDIKKSMS